MTVFNKIVQVAILSNDNRKHKKLLKILGRYIIIDINTVCCISSFKGLHHYSLSLSP